MHRTPGKKAARSSVTSGFAWMPVLAACVVAAACTDSTGPDRQASIEPAAPTIALQSSAQGLTLNTSVTLTNTSSHLLSWSYCGVGLEKAGLPALPPGKSAWEPVWSRICYLLAANPAAVTGPAISDPIYLGSVLKPGERVTIPILAVVGQLPYPNFTGEPGLYRFRLSLSSQILGIYVPVPYESSVSDSFTLLPAPLPAT